MAQYYVEFEVVDEDGKVILEDGYTVEAINPKAAEVFVRDGKPNVNVLFVSPVGECGC